MAELQAGLCDGVWIATYDQVNESHSSRSTAAATVVTAPNGILPGDEIVRVEQVSIDGLAVLLPAALPGVPDYIAAAESETKADELRPSLAAALDARGAVPYQPNTDAVFGFYAAAGSAVTAAVAGLEGFANHTIGRFASTAGTVEYQGETRDRRALSDMPLNDRLGHVLPELTGAPSPTTEPWWPTLRRVQSMAALSRHGVTQPIKRGGLAGEKSLTQRYCDREYRGAAGVMLEVFEYFSPGWIDARRLARLPPAPNAP